MEQNRRVITMACPSCGGRLAIAADADGFVCDYCGGQHSLDLPEGMTLGTQMARREPILLCPKGVAINKSEQELEISWGWFSREHIMLLLVCLFWDIGLFVWLNEPGDIPTDVLLGCLAPYMLVAVVLTYVTTAALFNHTRIYLDRQTFSLQHAPLPWPGAARLDRIDLYRLEFEEGSKDQPSKGVANRRLYAVLLSGRRLRLSSYFGPPLLGAYLKAQLENWLELPGRVVYDEVGRRDR